MTDENERKAIEAGAPARLKDLPPADVSEPAASAENHDGKSSTASNQMGAEYSVNATGDDSVGGKASPLRLQMAGFGSRLIAYILDLIIISVLSVPLKFAFGTFWVLFPFPFFGEWAVVDWLARTTTMFLYFGWFYKEKGASPGKMLLGIEVVDLHGRRLGYGQTFGREIVGKVISGVPLLIGYLIAAFRADGKALHDLLFGTRVVVRNLENDPRDARS